MQLTRQRGARAAGNSAADHGPYVVSLHGIWQASMSASPCHNVYDEDLVRTRADVPSSGQGPPRSVDFFPSSFCSAMWREEKASAASKDPMRVCKSAQSQLRAPSARCCSQLAPATKVRELEALSQSSGSQNCSQKPTNTATGYKFEQSRDEKLASLYIALQGEVTSEQNYIAVHSTSLFISDITSQVWRKGMC